jgi:hypothetical protein
MPFSAAAALGTGEAAQIAPEVHILADEARQSGEGRDCGGGYRESFQHNKQLKSGSLAPPHGNVL